MPPGGPPQTRSPKGEETDDDLKAVAGSKNGLFMVDRGLGKRGAE